MRLSNIPQSILSTLRNAKSRRRWLYAAFFLSYLAWSGFTSGVSGIGSVIAILVCYGLVWYLLMCILERRRLRLDESYDRIAGLTFFFLGIPFLILSSFVVYQLEIEPARLPHYILSNGEKTVHFQWMAHIAERGFYKSVREDLARVAKESGSGSVLYYEGVRDFSGSGAEEFSRMLGAKLTGETYGQVASSFWLVAQDNRDFFGILHRDENVDVSLNTILERVKERIWTGSASTGSSASWAAMLGGEATALDPIDPGAFIAEHQSWSTEREKRVFQAIGLATFSMAIKSERLAEAAFDTPEKKALYDAILEDRNKVVSDAIVRSDAKTIYLLYGMLHAEGIIRNLKMADPRWEVQKIEWKTFLSWL